ncbi:Oidioi.mRNA.OKI2018_I69.XSR.g16867.t1.cds [Oikopleura dioica]|uniref:Oidioi.mRNA.OKI2018_I69.XSR.g16867.t1.cds n=1 Tax=Oikopleura dioica TaxID=34765 RepID=A0ABN7SMK7_OIKDI|nr:Oidioi.mRNA.OKI2018_I69.XSR.g16867.t1.cds [Oikopleura dioica]
MLDLLIFVALEAPNVQNFENKMIDSNLTLTLALGGACFVVVVVIIALLSQTSNFANSGMKFPLLRRNSAAASVSSKEENRKFLEETFDIQQEEDDLEQGAAVAQFDKRPSSACSEQECDYESDGDHEHLIAHIARNSTTLQRFSTLAAEKPTARLSISPRNERKHSQKNKTEEEQEEEEEASEDEQSLLKSTNNQNQGVKEGHEGARKEENVQELERSLEEDVPEPNPDYQPAYDTIEKPWPWNISENQAESGEKNEVKSKNDVSSATLPMSKEPANATPKKTSRRITVTILECNDLPNQDRGVAPIIQVRIEMFPSKRKYKTKVQHVDNPKFNECFKVSRIPPEDVEQMGCRIRLYGIGKVRDRLVGEALLHFSDVNLLQQKQLTVTLEMEPRASVNRNVLGGDGTAAGNTTDSGSSLASFTHGSQAELLFGLSYSPLTGRLSVELLKGSHFRNLTSQKAPDTFVTLTLLDGNCKEVTRSKSTIRKAQPNPVYKESFFFQVALSQLSQITVLISVFSRKGMAGRKKEMIGWISLGANSSAQDEADHWEEMRRSLNTQVCRWHTLIES